MFPYQMEIPELAAQRLAALAERHSKPTRYYRANSCEPGACPRGAAPSGGPNQDGGPSFFPQETVKRQQRDKVYARTAGLEAVQSNGAAHPLCPRNSMGVGSYASDEVI